MTDPKHRRDPESALSRREFSIAAGLAAVVGCAGSTREPIATAAQPALPASCHDPHPGDVDYVVIGSGAGGGPLACNLARAGYTVALLEAGSDPASWTRDVPALHPAASEDPAMRWDFFVRTYADEARQRRNAKYQPGAGGVLYPRAGTLGGCTAHNAMIMLYPHNTDWDEIAALFDDPSWRADAMRRYFQRFEHCDYAPESTASRHGYDGWLHTNVTDPWLAVRDGRLRAIVEAAIAEAESLDPHLVRDAFRMSLSSNQSLWDPNDWRMVRSAAEGMVFVPLHVRNGTRECTRDYIHETQARCPGNLRVELDALATRVLLDDAHRATGVEYLKGARLYRASPPIDATTSGEIRQVRARREVIVCGGVFNSPQILMLSGIGPRQQLEALGIDVRVDLPGVGKNLQDRYEISVVSELSGDFDVLHGVTLRPPDPSQPDPAMRQWWFERTGPYTSNGVVAALVKRSQPTLPVPDLFVFGIVGKFRGYYPGYSRDLVADHHHFTWCVLKGHGHNRAGEVRLRSRDPRDPPEIQFHVFDEGSPGFDADLDAIVDGVTTARRIMARLGSRVRREEFPGPERAGEALRQYIRDNAWGHHASCTNKMGPSSDPAAVVDQNFRVHGTSGLRVVDASVFPKIPGLFIVSAVYMLAEKATDVILEDARAT